MSLITPSNRGLQEVFLKPGRVYIAEDPRLIVTILGSCIAVCIHVPRLRVSAMSHSLLPSWDKSSDKIPLNYVDRSVSYMVESLAALGAGIEEMQVKIFGGADVSEYLRRDERIHKTIGRQNIHIARKIVKEYGLAVGAEKVGGLQGYKIWYYTDTGDILLRHINKVNYQELN